MPQKKGLFERIRDTLQANRNRLVYGLILLGGLFALAGWALLPDVVALQVGAVPSVAKNTALLAHLGITWGFTAAFWFRPREIAYFVAACLGVFLSAGALIINLGV